MNEYKYAKSHSEREQITNEVVGSIRASGGRFLKRLSKSGHSTKGEVTCSLESDQLLRNLYALADDRIAVLKTKQAFRYCLKACAARRQRRAAEASRACHRADHRDHQLDNGLLQNYEERLHEPRRDPIRSDAFPVASTVFNVSSSTTSHSAKEYSISQLIHSSNPGVDAMTKRDVETANFAMHETSRNEERSSSRQRLQDSSRNKIWNSLMTSPAPSQTFNAECPNQLDHLQFIPRRSWSKCVSQGTEAFDQRRASQDLRLGSADHQLQNCSNNVDANSTLLSLSSLLEVDNIHSALGPGTQVSSLTSGSVALHDYIRSNTTETSQNFVESSDLSLYPSLPSLSGLLQARLYGPYVSTLPSSVLDLGHDQMQSLYSRMQDTFAHRAAEADQAVLGSTLHKGRIKSAFQLTPLSLLKPSGNFSNLPMMHPCLSDPGQHQMISLINRMQGPAFPRSAVNADIDNPNSIIHQARRDMNSLLSLLRLFPQSPNGVNLSSMPSPGSDSRKHQGRSMLSKKQDSAIPLPTDVDLACPSSMTNQNRHNSGGPLQESNPRQVSAGTTSLLGTRMLHDENRLRAVLPHDATGDGEIFHRLDNAGLLQGYLSLLFLSEHTLEQVENGEAIPES